MNDRNGDVNINPQIDLAEVLKGDPEALKIASDQFQPLCESWTFENWGEIDISRFVKDMNYRGLLEERRKQGAVAQERECLQCPKFLQHVSFQRSPPLLVRIFHGI